MRNLRAYHGVMLVTLGFAHTATPQSGSGCLGAAAGGTAMNQGYRMTAVNESCRRLLVEEHLWKERLAVTSDIYLCNAMNAFAQPSGNVFLGQPLMDRIRQQKGPAFT